MKPVMADDGELEEGKGVDLTPTEKPRPRRRLTKGERTKRRLMAAARQVLADKGYPTTRVEDITTEAGVAKGTFYLHFKDKNELLMSVMKEEFEEIEHEMLSSRSQDDPFLAILKPNIAYARKVFEKTGLYRAFVQFINIHPEALAQWSDGTLEWLSRLESAMDRRLGRGRTDEATRVMVTYAMSWMVDGVFLSILNLDHPRLREVVSSPEQLAETLSVLWYRAVYGENPDPKQIERARPVLDFHLSSVPEDSRSGEPSSSSLNPPGTHCRTSPSRR